MLNTEKIIYSFEYSFISILHMIQLKCLTCLHAFMLLLLPVHCESQSGDQIHTRTTNYTFSWCINHWMRVHFDGGVLLFGGADSMQSNGGVHTSLTDCGTEPQGWRVITALNLYDVTSLKVSYKATNARLKANEDPAKLNCG